jgi:hypothetical protein
MRVNKLNVKRLEKNEGKNLEFAQYVFLDLSVIIEPFLYTIIQIFIQELN